MKKMLDLNELADLMRRNSGKSMMLDEDGGYRNALRSRASIWKSRPPKPFASGRFTFRVLCDKETGHFILWGTHHAVTFELDAAAYSATIGGAPSGGTG